MGTGDAECLNFLSILLALLSLDHTLALMPDFSTSGANGALFLLFISSMDCLCDILDILSEEFQLLVTSLPFCIQGLKKNWHLS